MKTVASPAKIAYHRERVDAYLRCEPVFPVTLELDITSQCTRACRDCPSSRSEFRHNLPFDFISNLLHSLEGQTRGLLMTGGEATMSPLFGDTLALARKLGFKDVAVVTNGSLLHKPDVAEALMEHASTIRLSMYDWDAEGCRGMEPTLKRIEGLREMIDSEKSRLKIGISVLTAGTLKKRFGEIADAVRDAGAHWIYYHPMCTGWSDGNLQPFDQSGVIDAIVSYREKMTNGFDVFVCPSRYEESSIEFDGYHAAHFLLVVGADGKNYLGAEVKYQDRFAIADVMGQWRPDFLQQPERLARIASFNSKSYSALKSRHRGVLYNHFVEHLKNELTAHGRTEPRANGEFLFPHIL
jgi:organic radical activating enzyme